MHTQHGTGLSDRGDIVPALERADSFPTRSSTDQTTSQEVDASLFNCHDLLNWHASPLVSSLQFQLRQREATFIVPALRLWLPPTSTPSEQSITSCCCTPCILRWRDLKAFIRHSIITPSEVDQHALRSAAVVATRKTCSDDLDTFYERAKVYESDGTVHQLHAEMLLRMVKISAHTHSLPMKLQA